jgi:hypothetical protein
VAKKIYIYTTGKKKFSKFVYKKLVIFNFAQKGMPASFFPITIYIYAHSDRIYTVI